MKTQEGFRNHISFLKQWFHAPLRTGAIAPSSKQLANAMVFAAAAQPGGKILELGPGTGIVTHALIAAGISEGDLILVETNPHFAKSLAQKFPKAKIIINDAFLIVQELAEQGAEISAIISSLPLFVYKKQQRELLYQNALRLVGPQGRLVQFTYNLVSPVAPKANFRATPSRRIWANMPPATVWTYQFK